MAASNATAHVLIVESLRDIISSCKKIGSSYNPEYPEIRIPALESQLALTEYHQLVVKDKVNVFYHISNERTGLYAGLPSLCNRLLQVLADMPMPADTFRKATAINVIIQETRLYKNFSIAQYEAQSGTGSNALPGRSYEQLEHCFAQLVEIIATFGNTYQPEDIELQYPVLCDYRVKLSRSNRLIQHALAEVNMARQQRNELLPVLAATHRQLHKKVHTYLRKSFGVSSWQFRQAKLKS